MTRVVRIREVRSSGPVVDVAIDVSTGARYSTTVSSPITSEEQTLVSWYFGKWLGSQFGDSGQATLAEEALKRCGERLFQSVFGGEDGRQAWASLRDRDNEIADVRIEISGSSALQRLPWEWMRTPGVEEPIALNADIVRTDGESAVRHRSVSADILNVLIIRSRSRKVDVNPAVVARPLLRTARSANVRIRVHVLRPSTLAALQDHLREAERSGSGPYHVLHFDVHGSLLQRNNADSPSTRTAFLELEAPEGDRPAFVDAGELARIIEPHGAGLVVLTACESAKHDPDGSMKAFAEALFDAGIPCVLGMADAISTTAAELFVQNFYLAVTLCGEPVVGLRLARKALRVVSQRGTAFDTSREMQDWLLPVLYVRTAPRFAFRRLDDRPHHDPATFVRDAKGDPIGRDLDAMNLERLLLAGRKVIVVIAGPGVGRTTFLRHLGWFWSETGFVEPDRVERFGLSGERYSIHDITATLSRGRSTGQRLILLDDVDQLGIERPSDILHAAAGEGVWVIAATRSLTPDLEGWLDDVYMLPPIDLIKAAELTFTLLFEHKVSMDTPDCAALSDWLGGLPLAIRAIVPALATRSCARLLTEVETGSLNIDFPEPRDGTRSLRGSIERSLAALSPKSRSLVVYLAPFGPEASTGLVDEYAMALNERVPEFGRGLHGLVSDLVITSLAVLRQDASNESVWLNPLLTMYLRHVLRQPALDALRTTIDSAFLDAVSRRARTLVNQEVAGSPDVRRRARQFYAFDRFAYRHAIRVGLERQSVEGDTYAAAVRGFSAVGRAGESVRLGEMVAGALAASEVGMSAGVARVLQELAERHLAEGNLTHARYLLTVMRNRWSEVEDPDQWLSGGLLQLEAELALREHRSADAAALARRALDLSASDADVRDLLPTKMLLANALLGQRQFLEAERYAREVLESPDDLDELFKAGALHLLGLCAFETGRSQESIEALSGAARAYQVAGSNDRAAVSYGALAQTYRASGLLSDAHDNYTVALRLATPSLGGGKIAEMHHGLGLSLRDMGRPRDAEEHFQEAARIWAKEGNSERAAAALERSLDSRVDREPEARMVRALLLAHRADGLMQAGDTAGAIALLRGAIADVDLTLETMNGPSGLLALKAKLVEGLTIARIVADEEDSPEVALREVLHLHDRAVAGERDEPVSLAHRARARKMLGLVIAERDPNEAASLIATSDREIASLRGAANPDEHLRKALSDYDDLPPLS